MQKLLEEAENHLKLAMQAYVLVSYDLMLHEVMLAWRAISAAQHGVHPTNDGLCAECGLEEWHHPAIGHEFKPAISG